MGRHHVSLQINEEGLVTSVGETPTQQDLYETCVLCGDLTDVLKTTHIDFRTGYVEGSGQCCISCFNRTNEDIRRREQEYIERTMHNRRTLITVSAEQILDTPNDQELGALVRQVYYSSQIEQPQARPMICSICGGDTRSIDYDYLIGTDHLECRLTKKDFTFLK